MRLLLRGGTVIDTEPEPTVRPNTDVLIEDGRIQAVSPELGAHDAEMIDASGFYVLPGFVDTHRHVWETALRGLGADLDLGGYLVRILGELGPRFTPEDLYAGNVAGALECLDAGITTVQDFSHIQSSAEHTDALIEGLRASGIRAIFGYGYPPLADVPLDQTETARVRDTYFPDQPGLLTMALAPIGPSYASAASVESDWRLAAELGLPIVAHVSSGPVAEKPVEFLASRNLLGPRTLYVHGNSLPDSELKLIAERGGAVSITPAIEEQMSVGGPMIGRLRAHGVTTGLGIDVVAAVAGDMFSVMRATLAIGTRGTGPKPTAAEVLRLATLGGAQALGLADQIGSLQVGKQADIQLIRADDINLAGGSHDPIGTVVTGAHPGNVDTVLVAGVPVKRHGRLLHPALTETLSALNATTRRVVV